MAAENDNRRNGSLRGLTEAEAQRRHRQEGANELPRTGTRSPIAILLSVVKEPMLALLLVGGIIYLLIGSAAEAMLLLAFGTFSVLVTLIQESRTERVLESLRDLSSPRALVIRDGAQRRIPGREVVCGDLVILGEGDRIPADVRLIEARSLMADESLLTGESVPVRKRQDNDAGSQGYGPPGGDDLPVAFSGTLVVRGSGIGEVVAIGIKSEIGQIGASLLSLEPETPRLQAQTRRLVRIFGLIAGVCSLAVFLVYGIARSQWLDGILAGIALGMSLIPEEFPVVLTVFTAVGAWRISRAHVLTRKAAAIETLGAATVLCTDKTGTLTENRMSVAELRPWRAAPIAVDGTQALLPAPYDALASAGIAASAALPTDPMDRALHALAPRTPPQSERNLLREYGLQPDLLAMSNAWQTSGDECFIAAKGAPEAIAALCRLSPEETAALHADVSCMGQAGMRVLGIAHAKADGGSLPESQRGFQFTFLGLVGLRDPLRADVADAVAECRAAGIKVVMMTGDGVNDAPALRAAHIGIAMGGRGTDVAREAASIVLLKDDFGSVVKAIRLGRRIYDNLRKAMAFIVAVHVPIAGLALFSLMLGWPILFGPIHIAFLEMVIDPVCTLVFEAEAEEEDVMRRPPRKPTTSLFSLNLLLWGGVQGAATLMVTGGIFLYAWSQSMPDGDIRALVFTSLVCCLGMLILVDRSFSPSVRAAVTRHNTPLAMVFGIVCTLILLVKLLPPMRDLFSFGALHLLDFATISIGAVLLGLSLETAKSLYRKLAD